MREGELPAVDYVLRPAFVRVRAVVGPGFDETDAAIGVLAQARGQHAAGGAAPEDDDVEPACVHSAEGRHDRVEIRAPDPQRRGRSGEELLRSLGHEAMLTSDRSGVA